MDRDVLVVFLLVVPLFRGTVRGLMWIMTDRTLAKQAERVAEMAHSRGLRLATAESCTAGALATLLADTVVGGEVLHGGFVTYTKLCKTEVLGISEELLSSKSAVSRPVAEAMARGALTACAKADVAVAITCVAGPQPDEDGNPVGLTEIAVAARDGPTWAAKFEGDQGSRNANRARAIVEALELLAEAIGKTSAA
jgi:nicotinamide-nucleotide amidase